MYACLMVREGAADAVLGGLTTYYPETIRPALQVVGRADGVKHAAGLYMVALPDRRLLFFADTTVNIDPDARSAIFLKWGRDKMVEPTL